MLHENYKTGITFYKINTAINHNVHEHWDKNREDYSLNFL